MSLSFSLPVLKKLCQKKKTALFPEISRELTQAGCRLRVSILNSCVCVCSHFRQWAASHCSDYIMWLLFSLPCSALPRFHHQAEPCLSWPSPLQELHAAHITLLYYIIVCLRHTIHTRWWQFSYGVAIIKVNICVMLIRGLKVRPQTTYSNFVKLYFLVFPAFIDTKTNI